MDRFQPLTQFLDAVPDHFHVPGCCCAVALDGVLVYSHAAGCADLASQRPISLQNTYWLYSATKLFTCTAALQLVEEGRLGLEEPVSLYLPEYAQLTVLGEDGTVRPARQALLVRHLFTMTGGLDYDLNRPALRALLESSPETATTRQAAAALAADPLRFDPGSHFLYSMCHDVLGAVVEAVSGQTLGTYMREHLFSPLGMTDMTFHPTAGQLARLATQYIHLDENGTLQPAGQENPYRLSACYESGGAGLLGTVEDYIRLPAALSMGGALPGGVRILRPETVALMGRPWLDQVQRADFIARSVSDRCYSYGLGVRVRVDASQSAAPEGEFGWDGAAGAYALIDPVHHAALFYAQHVGQSALTFHHLHPALRETACACWAAG